MKICDSGDNLTRADLLQYEKQLNFKFPEDYKLFMLNHNGGSPEKDLVFDFIDPINNQSNSSDVRGFFIFYKEANNKYDNIVRVYTIMHSEGQIEEGYFPIADDSGGNPICMYLYGDNYGGIYFCDHELEDPDTGYLVTTKIANSFQEFINNLHEFNTDEY